jgi:signal transduction histidine kinase
VGLKWLQHAWDEFKASADLDDLIAKSNPALILGSAGAPILAILALAYIPPLARVSRIDNVWEACSLMALGGVFTYVAWLKRCQGTWGTLATLFDNACYSAGLALVAASCAETTGIALAVVHGLMIVSFPARDYALTWLFSMAISLPVLGIIIGLGPSLPVGLVMIASLGMMHIVSQETRVKREDRLRQLRLEQALGAADKLADESVQAALTTTLLTLGHFLHELRNYQTAIEANLEYVEAAGNLQSGPSEALAEAQNAQRGQADLLRRTIEELRGRSAGGSGVFLLRQTVKELAAAERGVQLTLSGDLEFEIRGNVEHFRVVMLNLVRNAIQAGAHRVECRLWGGASGHAVRLSVSDDGTGIVEAKRAHLFDSFALSEKPGGSGLGLYLVRRYVELLGGTIKVGEASGQDDDESERAGRCHFHHRLARSCSAARGAREGGA